MTTGVARKMLSVNFPKSFKGDWRNLANAPVLGTGGAILGGASPSSPTKESNNFGFKTSVDTGVLKKICCSACCIEDKMLQYRKGMYREIGTSSRLARLRNYQPNSYIPTTAYFLATPTCFF